MDLTMTATPELVAMVRHMLAHPEGLPWSLQGFGMLRCDIDGRDYRLHVWDHRFRAPSVASIHDHPWDLESLVLSGSITNVLYKIEEDTAPVSRANHYGNLIQPGPEAREIERPRPMVLRVLERSTYRSGAGYAQRADEVHDTEFTTGTVTLVRRTNRQTTGAAGDKARIFWPKAHGRDWLDATPQEATREKVKTICDVALAMWGQYAPEAST
jgi:hypothetical protein